MMNETTPAAPSADDPQDLIDCMEAWRETMTANQQLDLADFIEKYGSDLVELWTQRYGGAALRGMHLTALITICRHREIGARAHEARLENAYYGNRVPESPTKNWLSTPSGATLTILMSCKSLMPVLAPGEV